jgi:ribosome biogenesis GTPase A
MDFFDLMFQIANKPSIYVLDTPGVLVPSISDIETGLKLALAGTISIEDIYILILCAKKESH